MCACYLTLSWNRRTASEQWEHLYFRKGVTFPMLGKQTISETEARVATVHWVDGAGCSHCPGSILRHCVCWDCWRKGSSLCSYLGLLQARNLTSVWELMGEWTAVPEGKAFSLHTRTRWNYSAVLPLRLSKHFFRHQEHDRAEECL